MGGERGRDGSQSYGIVVILRAPLANTPPILLSPKNNATLLCFVPQAITAEGYMDMVGPAAIFFFVFFYVTCVVVVINVVVAFLISAYGVFKDEASEGKTVERSVDEKTNPHLLSARNDTTDTAGSAEKAKYRRARRKTVVADRIGAIPGLKVGAKRETAKELRKVYQVE